MHKFILAAATACWLPLPVPAMPDDAQQVDADVVAQLALSTTFAIGQVGFVGHISHGEQLYRRILRSPSGFRIFNEMLRGTMATTEARLYAACGVRELAPAAFDEMTSELGAADSSASVLYTDILRRERVSGRGGVLDRIKKNGCGTFIHP